MENQKKEEEEEPKYLRDSKYGHEERENWRPDIKNMPDAVCDFHMSPDANLFALSVAGFYGGQAVNLYFGINFFLSGQYFNAVLLFLALVVPSVCSSMVMFVQYSIPPAKPKEFIRKTVLLILTQTNHAVYARDYLQKGQKPSQIEISNLRHNQLSWGSVPSFIVLVNSLVTSSDPLEANLPALAKVCLALLTNPRTGKIDYLCDCLPGTAPPYRIWYHCTGSWKLETSPRKHQLVSQLVDWTSITYRMALYSWLVIFCGWSAYLVLIFMHFVFAWITSSRFAQVLCVDRGMKIWGLMIAWSCCQVGNMMIHETLWMAPAAGINNMHFNFFPFRIVEVLVVMFLYVTYRVEVESWWNMNIIYTIAIYGGLNALVWFPLYWWYARVICAKGHLFAYNKTNAWYDMLRGMTKKVDTIVSV